MGQFFTSGPPGLGVPAGYVSGSPLSGSLTFSGASFASLGLTPGVYTWSWGSGANADTFTLNITEEAAVTTDDLLLLFDQAVADGDLYGVGSGDLARLRLHLMRLMLVAADELVEGDHIDLACAQLQAARHFTDGQPLPRDLVAGPVTPELALLITDVRETLGCE